MISRFIDFSKGQTLNLSHTGSSDDSMGLEGFDQACRSNKALPAAEHWQYRQRPTAQLQQKSG
jgi:hypothetical protein